MKLLAWVLLVALVLWALHSKKQQDQERRRNSTAPDGPYNGQHDRADTAPERMLQCAHCSVHVPASETVVDAAGTVFCSEEHRLEHVRS